MTCKHCGKNNPNDATVCKYCGEELAEETAAAPKAKPKMSRADAQSASIQVLRQMCLILAAVALVALVLGFAGLLRGCSAVKAVDEAKTAAAAAKTAADEAKTTADQNARALSQAMDRIETLEEAQTTPPVTPTTPDEPTEPDTETGRRYPATDPTTAINVTVGADGKVTALAYTDAGGANVALEIGAAGVPLNYVLNDTDELVGYESDIDLCAAATANVSGDYTAQVSYCWESLTGDAWTPRPDKLEPCLTVSPGYWFSTRAQYRCEITIDVFDSAGAECDSVNVYTTAVTYTDWEGYAEAHADEHDVYLQWSDMMKTYE